MSDADSDDAGADSDAAGDPPFPDPETRAVLAADCRRCPALVASRTRISWGTGPADARVMVVGEAPGAGASTAERWQGGNHTGMAYTTRHSGRRLRALFARLGYDPYYTNAVKCFPADGEGSNREPIAEERSNCRAHLETELAAVDPQVVVTTGKHATASVLALDGWALDGFLDAVLEPVRLSSPAVRVLPILHPSYQEVWRARLGDDADAYEAAIAERLP